MRYRSTYDPSLRGYFIERQEGPGQRWEYVPETCSFTKWGSLFELWNIVRKHRREMLGIIVIKEVEV